jgi:TPR repeat protein
MPKLSVANVRRDNGFQLSIYYDLPVTSGWGDDNRKAIEALISVKEDAKVRFNSSTYNRSEDIILNFEQLTELRLAYRMWQLMCKGKADLSFLEDESEYKTKHDAEMARRREEYFKKYFKGPHRKWEAERQQRDAGEHVYEQQQEAARQRATEQQRREEEKKQQATLAKVMAFRLQSASNGLPTAQYQVGIAYLKGEGVETNKGLGFYWLNKAAAQGNPDAKTKLLELGQNAPQ